MRWQWRKIFLLKYPMVTHVCLLYTVYEREQNMEQFLWLTWLRLILNSWVQTRPNRQTARRANLQLHMGDCSRSFAGKISGMNILTRSLAVLVSKVLRQASSCRFRASVSKHVGFCWSDAPASPYKTHVVFPARVSVDLLLQLHTFLHKSLHSYKI